MVDGVPQRAEPGGPTPDADGRLERWTSALVRRATRSQIRRVIPAARIAIVAAWIASAVLAWVVTLPFIAVPESGSAATWVRVLVYASIAVLTTVGVVTGVASAARARARWLPAMGLPVAIIAVGACPVVALGAAGWWVAAVAAGAGVVAAAASASIGAARGTPRAGWVTLAGGLLAAIPWVAVAALSPTQTDDDASPLWLVVVVFGVEAATLATFYGFATAARSRVSGSQRVLTASMSLAWLTAVVVGAVAIFAARLTIGRWVFEDRYGFWAMRTWWAWPMSAALGVAIVALAIRAQRRPLEDRGFGALLAILVVGFAYPSVLMAIWIVGQLLEATTGWPQSDITAAVDALPYVWAAASAATVVFVVHPRWRSTTARTVAVVSLPYLLAGTLSSEIDRVWPGGPAWWASPPPIVAAILLAVAVITAGQWFGRWTSVPRVVLVRLAVFPLIVLQAVDLLPAFIDGHIQSIVAVLLLAAVILLLLPPVAADRVRHTATIGAATSGVLFALVGTLLSATAADRNRVTLVLSMLMLSVPVMTALVLRTTPRPRPKGLPRPD